MGRHAYNKSGHLSNFTSLKHLMTILKCRASFYALPKMLSITLKLGYEFHIITSYNGHSQWALNTINKDVTKSFQYQI